MGCYIIRTFVIKTLSDIAVYVVGNQVGIGLREIAYWRALGDDVSDKFVVDFADPLLVRTIRIAKEHFCTCSAI